MSDDDFDDDDVMEGPAEESGTHYVLDADGADLAARNRIREQLNADVEAFLASGGKITNVDANVMSDPPKRPQSNYGGQPI
jgi:hypothetical protein